MSPADLEDFFAPFAKVNVRRMFSGHGIYVGTACFAISAFGTIWLKADADTEAAFAAAGCRPFSMTTPDGSTRTIRSFWSLPEPALDDAEALKRWCGPALRAAQATALEHAAKKWKRVFAKSML
ncbi:MAG TPA: TfoX/Sxy family protein [Beijerinckiaceae bacterium]|nr:TfoX/Sxy family protein [Beijerinckiaceae bacterium]